MSDEKLLSVAVSIRNGLAPGTLRDYAPSLVLWREFREESTRHPSKVNPLTLSQLYFIGAPRSHAVLAVLSFLEWLVGTKGLPRHTASHHLTGVRHGFVIHLGESSIFDDHSAIALARKAYTAKNSRSERKAAVVVKIKPLTLQQLDWLRETMWLGSWSSTIDTRMTYMAISLSMNIILRIGEVARDGVYQDPKTGQILRSDHRFYLEDLFLEDSSGRPYDYLTFISSVPPPSIVYIRLDGMSSKTSGRQSVQPRPYHFFLDAPNITPREVQFFSDFLYWISECGVSSPLLPLFSRIHPSTGLHKELTATLYRSALKSSAEHFGLDPKYFSGKSTRGGGASSMAAADRPVEDMRKLTGHANWETTVDHYVTDVGYRGNVFRNEDRKGITTTQLKRSLPAPVATDSKGAPSTSKIREQMSK
jgi:hypothetical protein